MTWQVGYTQDKTVSLVPFRRNMDHDTVNAPGTEKMTTFLFFHSSVLSFKAELMHLRNSAISSNLDTHGLRKQADEVNARISN